MLRAPWVTKEDKVVIRAHELALAEIAELEQTIYDVRRYLLPMLTWSDLDDHTKGHVKALLDITERTSGGRLR